MSLKKLEQEGAGIILDITKEQVLQLAPRVYTATWEALLNNSGDYAIVLGAGTAEREVFFGLEGQDLTQYHLPTVHCYDISKSPPKRFLERKNKFSGIGVEYFPNTDLNSFQLSKEYIDNTRLISMHGVLDYLTLPGIANLVSQIWAIRPEALSFRLCLMRGNFFKDFVTPKQLRQEQLSIEKIKRGQTRPMEMNRFLESGIIQVALPTDHKRRHNLSPDYPGSYIMPGALVAVLLNEGYKLPIIDEYSEDMNSLLLLFTEKEK